MCHAVYIVIVSFMKPSFAAVQARSSSCTAKSLVDKDKLSFAMHGTRN